MPCKPLSCVFGKCFIPLRYVISIMMMCGLFYCYTNRVVLNIAINEIIIDPSHEDNETEPIDPACPELEDEDEINEIGGGTYEWSESQIGLAKGIFYGGYLITHIPFGLLADKLGGRWIMFGSVGCSAVTVLLSPLTIQVGGFWWFFILRFVTGLAQGGMFPCLSSLMNQWFPLEERGVLSAIVYSGQNLGTILGNIGTGQMIGIAGDWTLPFYVWGVLSMSWCAVSVLTLFSTPKSHPFITMHESEFLQENIEKHSLAVSVPWKKMLKSPVLLSLVSAQIGHDYILFSLVTDLPKYMKDVLRFNVKNNGTVSALPFVAVLISSLISGFVSDIILQKHLLSLINLRRMQTIISAMGPATCILLAGYVGCNRMGAVFLFVFGTFLMGPFFCGTKITANDVSVHYGGLVMAMMNGIGAAMGLFSPIIVSTLVVNKSLNEWRSVFWIIWCLAAATTIHYVVFVKTERQTWDFTGDEQ